MKEEKELYKPAEKLKLRDFPEGFPKIFQSINCPSCQARVQASDISLDTNMAKCSNCHVIFSIEEEVKQVQTKEQEKEKPDYMRPEGVELFSYQGNLDITLPQIMQGFDLFMMIIAPSVTFLSSIVYATGKIPITWPAIFAVVSIFYIFRWYTYSKFKTYVQIGQERLTVSHSPKNFKKDVSINVSEIDQLYLKNAPDGMGYISVHAVVNGVEGQKHVRLLTAKTLAKAKYIEQEIEKHLEIKDRKVDEATV